MIRHHPFIKGVIAVAAFILIAEILVAMAPLAWSVEIPITDHLTVNLGDLPQWIIALVAAGGLYKAAKAEQHALVAVAKIEEVRHETNSMRAAIEASQYKDGKAEGRRQERENIANAADAVRSEAVADAATKAEIKVIENPISEKG